MQYVLSLTIVTWFFCNFITTLDKFLSLILWLFENVLLVNIYNVKKFVCKHITYKTFCLWMFNINSFVCKSCKSLNVLVNLHPCTSFLVTEHIGKNLNMKMCDHTGLVLPVTKWTRCSMNKYLSSGGKITVRQGKGLDQWNNTGDVTLIFKTVFTVSLKGTFLFHSLHFCI